MKLSTILRCIRVARRLKAYEPKRVRFLSLVQWLQQFPKRYHTSLIKLADHIRFVTKDDTVGFLTRVNEQILDSLRQDEVGLDRRNVIYVTTDKAGSSSGVMLNLLRDHGNLERRGAVFLDSNDIQAIQNCTAKKGYGAIIYVDDFAGTGRQFLKSRERVAEYIVGSFSEFFLLTCICEEAKTSIESVGVETKYGFVHFRAERPLLDDCSHFDSRFKCQLLELSHSHWNKKSALGYRGLATSIVFYRNAPNTTPLVLRGNLGQHPWHGILPRYDDLPNKSDITNS